MIKAVLFDMDGVLIDAKDWHYEALNRALEKFGMAIDRDAHLSTYDGLPTRRKLEMLSKARGLPVGLHSFINQLKQAYTQEIAHACCKPNFAHRRALSRLREAGLLLGVCSNSVRASVELMMKLAKLDSYFDIMLSNEDVQRAKPDPEIYRTAIERLALNPADCLIVEDNEHGIQAARASGANVMMVRDVTDVSYEAIRKFMLGLNRDEGRGM